MSDTLDLLVGGGKGAPEKLLIIERPTADGQVRVRSWTSDDWSAMPTSADRSASGLLDEIEAAVRTGRSVNQEMSVVRRWLGSRT
ncbi:MAG TPA: hypothetical protein VJN70_17165 [Gemmatimonadaceae bacterium]|nr:hypothetical protein [Gemmatimonadaceae bacterium]